MKVYLNCTANLGDFVQSLPVLSGLVKNYGKVDFIIKKEMEKFMGIKEFLMYQDLFNSVEYDQDLFLYGTPPVVLSSWTREDKNNPNRPIETCRYENWLKDNYKFDFEVDDGPSRLLIAQNAYVNVKGMWGGIDDREILVSKDMPPSPSGDCRIYYCFKGKLRKGPALVYALSD